MIDRLNKYGILDDIGEEFLGRATQLVKSGHKFVYVLDNIDWEEKVHDMRIDVQNKSVHAVATSIVSDRVADVDLPDLGPQQDLKQSNVSDVVCLSEGDIKSIRSRYRTLIAQLLFEHFPAFAMFKHCIPDTTDCQYAREMSFKFKEWKESQVGQIFVARCVIKAETVKILMTFFFEPFFKLTSLLSYW